MCRNTPRPRRNAIVRYARPRCIALRARPRAVRARRTGARSAQRPACPAGDRTAERRRPDRQVPPGSQGRREPG